MSVRPAVPPKRIPPVRPANGAVNGHHRSAIVDPLAAFPRTLPADTFALQAQLDQARMELENLHERLHQAQKLASLGTMAAMLAHEFNNLFTPIVGYAQHALKSNDVQLMRKALTKALEHIDIMTNMANRIGGFAGSSDDGIRPVKVRELVDNVIGCLGRDLAKDNIALSVRMDDELQVMANESRLMQVMFNLVLNARQAMLGSKGRLSIDAAPGDDDDIRINVRDTGCGIAPENIDRIFEPFFSTKTGSASGRKPLGLGLAICREIMNELNGRIEVSSELKVGTTFTLVLPGVD